MDNALNKLEKQLSTQKLINGVLLGGLVALGGLQLYQASAPKVFDEISVERINIVEKSGFNRMVLANSERSPGVDKYGKEVWRSEEARPGMIFYNDEGTENGGFVFRGHKKDGQVDHGLHMSFDRYNQDQTLMMQHIEQGDYQLSGLTVMDRSDEDMDFTRVRDYLQASKAGDTATADAIYAQLEKDKQLGTYRAFYGTLNGDAKLQLHDTDGNKRIQMVVTESGEAKLEFLDEKGQVILRLPEGTN
jgi:hypothetical protein